MVARGTMTVVALLGIGLTACVPEQIKQAERRPALMSAVPVAAPLGSTEPIGYARTVSDIARGTRVGSYVFGPPGCRLKEDHLWDGDRGAPLSPEYGTRFLEAAAAAGYTVVGNSGQLFNVAEERARIRFLVGARLTEIQLSLCDHQNYWTMAYNGPRGDAYAKFEWQVYSVREQRVVYETATDGNARTEAGTRDGVQILMRQAFSQAAANFAADPKFRDIVRGNADPLPASAVAPSAEAVLDIPRFAPFRDVSATRLAALRPSIVTIVVANWHGSGFFISDNGLILTNRHVVGEAETVNVRLLSGVEVTGRVLRRHALRDVALVKVELTRTQPLPLRTTPLLVGEEVYAMGAPVDTSLAASVTRGIVSAVRRELRGGVELGMIQSDAAIQGGNSGGPLLDAPGNVIGIAVEGHGQMNTGLNFFIPIDEALRYLNIQPGQPRDLRF